MVLKHELVFKFHSNPQKKSFSLTFFKFIYFLNWKIFALQYCVHWNFNTSCILIFLKNDRILTCNWLLFTIYFINKYSVYVYSVYMYIVSPVAQWLKICPPSWRPRFHSWVGISRGEMATHSSIGNPMDRGGWWAKSMGLQKSQIQLVPPPPGHIVSVLFVCVSLFFFFPSLSFLFTVVQEKHWSKWVLFIGVSVRLLLWSQDPFFSWLISIRPCLYPQYRCYWWRSWLWGTESQ